MATKKRAVPRTRAVRRTSATATLKGGIYKIEAVKASDLKGLKGNLKLKGRRSGAVAWAMCESSGDCNRKC